MDEDGLYFFNTWTQERRDEGSRPFEMVPGDTGRKEQPAQALRTEALPCMATILKFLTRRVACSYYCNVQTGEYTW